MVVTFGMSDLGPWSLMDSSAQSADVIMRMMARNSMSEKLAEDIDAAVKRISDSAYEIALGHTSFSPVICKGLALSFGFTS